MIRIRNLLTCCLFALVACFNFTISADQHFSYLADSFLHLKTYFLDSALFGHDTAFFQGKYYWPLGPLPALILVPFVWIFERFNLFFFQGYLQGFLVIGVFRVFFNIARKVGYCVEDSWFVAFAFCFASVFLGVAMYSVSWAFAQVLAVFLVASALLEYLGKKRHWLIGTLMAAALATRATAGLSVLFFVMAAAASEKSGLRTKITAICTLLMPILLAVMALALYNYERFDDALEQGYALQILYGAAARARSYGIVSLAHIPGNIFYFLFAGPLPVRFDEVSQVLKFPYLRANPWGMSLFITSPYFLYLFRMKYNDAISKLLLISIGVVAGCIFTYYGIGNVQFGYRYSLDFLPFLFFLLVRNYRKDHQRLSENFKRAILVTAVTNMYFVLTILQF